MPIQSEHRKPISPGARRQSGRARKRPVDDIPGIAIAIHQGGRGAGSHQGTGLDHIGFAVKDLKAFIIDESGVGIAFITNIEINERPIR